MLSEPGTSRARRLAGVQGAGETLVMASVWCVVFRGSQIKKL
jgi:hypothetical protein